MTQNSSKIEKKNHNRQTQNSSSMTQLQNSDSIKRGNKPKHKPLSIIIKQNEFKCNQKEENMKNP